MGGDKILGFSGKTVDQLWKSGRFDWIIVEADGAKRKPLKACNAAEPVIPNCTEHLILVAGLDALGHPLCEDHVHRALIFSQNSGLSLGTPLDTMHMARGLAVEMQKIDLVHPGALKYVVLNKADNRRIWRWKGLLLLDILVNGVFVMASWWLPLNLRILLSNGMR